MKRELLFDMQYTARLFGTCVLETVVSRGRYLDATGASRWTTASKRGSWKERLRFSKGNIAIGRPPEQEEDCWRSPRRITCPPVSMRTRRRVFGIADRSGADRTSDRAGAAQE